MARAPTTSGGDPVPRAGRGSHGLVFILLSFPLIDFHENSRESGQREDRTSGGRSGPSPVAAQRAGRCAERERERVLSTRRRRSEKFDVEREAHARRHHLTLQCLKPVTFLCEHPAAFTAHFPGDTGNPGKQNNNPYNYITVK